MSLCLNKIESLFNLANYGIWSGEAIPKTQSRLQVPPTCSEEGRQLEPQSAFWNELASAYAAQVHS